LQLFLEQLRLAVHGLDTCEEALVQAATAAEQLRFEAAAAYVGQQPQQPLAETVVRQMCEIALVRAQAATGYVHVALHELSPSSISFADKPELGMRDDIDNIDALLLDCSRQA
jgi:hypothetical protein